MFMKSKTIGDSACQAAPEPTAGTVPSAASGSAHEVATGISTTASDELAKNQREYRHKLKELFVTSKMSAKETVNLAQVSQRTGATGAEDVASVCASVNKNWQNAHRDLLRKLLRNCEFAKPYYAKIRVKNLRTGEAEADYLPVLLPHEMIDCIVNRARPDDLQLWQATDEFKESMREFCDRFSCDPDDAYPIGLHGDGVPFKAKMEDSLEQLSWSFASDPTSQRILFATIPKSFVVEGTFDDLFDVFSASMHISAAKVWPNIRLDGKDWLQSDLWRSKQAGCALAASAVLLQIRGDWMFYKQMFNLPSWSAQRICWKCCACKDETACNFKNPSASAAWRQRRLTQQEFFDQLVASGLKVNALFTCPCTELRHVQIDWLHTMDLGVSQVFLGNLMFEAMNMLEGSTQQSRVSKLWLILSSWYSRVQPPSKFQKLTLEMAKQSGKGPKLRSKAGECRYLIPFGFELAATFQHESLHWQTVFEAMSHLQAMYEKIDAEPYPAHEVAAHCHQFSLLYSALSAEAQQTGNILAWIIKPKFHLMIELLEYDCAMHMQSPRRFWTYLDESWGGELAKIAVRKGGTKTPFAVAESVIQRYRCWFG